MSFIEYLDRGVMLAGNGDCLIQGESSWSYRDVQRFSYRMAHKLKSLGLGADDKASVLSNNDASAFMCTFGFARAGVTWVPANPRNNIDDNQYLLDFFDCRLVIFHSSFAEPVRALRPLLPMVLHWVCLDHALADAPSLEHWLEGAPDTRVETVYEPDALAMIMPTGGTTGRSKGVQLTQRNVKTFLATYTISLHYAVGETPVVMAAAPLTHASGLLSLPTMARGGRIVILGKPDVADMLDTIERHRVTEFFLPPTVIYRMLDFPGVEARDFSSLRYFVYAAAPMSIDKLRRALAVFGPCMAQLFGQAEAPAVCTFLSPRDHYTREGDVAGDDVLSSCGHPTPLIQLRILDDDNREVAQGERGEVCVHGDLVTSGYYQQPEKTAETIIDGWLHTGDVGYLDDAGRLHLCDRKKDMIISGGFNVYPQEIEQVIWSHAAVQDCAVIGVPDEQWGESVKAVVELNAGAKVNAEELLALCKDRLGSLKSPKTIDFIDSLPRSPNGKVLKRDLRERYWAGQARRI